MNNQIKVMIDELDAKANDYLAKVEKYPDASGKSWCKNKALQCREAAQHLATAMTAIERLNY